MRPATLERTDVAIRPTPCRSRDKGRFFLDRLDAGGKVGAVAVRVRAGESAARTASLSRRSGRPARILDPSPPRDGRMRAAAWFVSAARPALAVGR